MNHPVTRPVMLAILDGWGWHENASHNAVAQGNTPVFDRLWATCPHAFLQASGGHVGLPDGQMGNSEVGHLNIGAGRVVMQDLPRIGAAVVSGEIAQTPAIQSLIAKLRASGGTCHLLGLLSPGGVHAHQAHAAGIAQLLHNAGIPVVVHAFSDGRDTPPRSGAEFIKAFEAELPEGVTIATICGRYYAMDRDNRWERVQKAYDLMVRGEGEPFTSTAEVFAKAYATDKGDEFILPAVRQGYTGMQDGDGILCFNFRADRVREILGALLDPAFKGFERGSRPNLAAAVGLTRYSDDLAQWLDIVFPPQSLQKGLGEVVALAGRTQIRMAETEKYPHVTYFFNGGQEDPHPGEDRVLVPSPKVATYDLQPEMSAPELAAKAVEAIGSGKYDLIVLNFANPDMVGHTGSLPAAIKAVETVDTCLGQIAEAIQNAGGALLVTADHGNCEVMLDPATSGPHTAHTTNPVPVFLLGAPQAQLRDGKLADLAPTLLQLMELPQPPEMSGQSLIKA